MTPKRQRFVEEYLVDLNGTQAAIRAGYSPRTANEQAARLLANVSVQAEIQAGRLKQQKRTEITADRVLQEYARIAFGEIGEVVDFSGDEPTLRKASDISESGRRLLASLRVKRYFEGTGEDARQVEVTDFKLWDKMAALGKLADHLGLAATRHLVGGDPNGIPLNITSANFTVDLNNMTTAQKRDKLIEMRRRFALGGMNGNGHHENGHVNGDGLPNGLKELPPGEDGNE